jgi:hypothetical protein
MNTTVSEFLIDIGGKSLSRNEAALFYQRMMLEASGMGTGYECNICGTPVSYAFQKEHDGDPYRDSVTAYCSQCRIKSAPHSFDAYMLSPVLLAMTAVQDAVDDLTRRTTR